MSVRQVGTNPHQYKPNTMDSVAFKPHIRNNDCNGLFSKENNADVFMDNALLPKAQKTNVDTKSIKEDLKETKSKQGFIGKLWDGFKNLTGIGAGSSKAEKAIEKYEKGLISEEEMQKAVNGYKEGQKTCVDVTADIASGILSVGAFALAVPTGGASLAVGLAAATAVGAGVKIGVKATDAILAGREYSSKDLLYDSATGAINGFMGPITNGIGNTVTKTIASKIIKEGAEEAVEQAAKQGFKQAAKSIILNQADDIVGGTIGKRAIAYAAGMAADGALSGASDNMVRAALNGGDVLKAGAEGAIGGLIMSPIIGGGFKAAGKAGHALNNKITMSKVLPDGLSTKFKQGSVGDCALLSTIDGLMDNPSTADKVKKSITKTVFGDYNVKIGDKIVKVSKDSLSDEILSDTTGIKLFEQAYKQLTGSIDGGFAEVAAKQFGLNPVHIANDSISDELLDALAKNKGDTVLSFGALVDADGMISPNGTSRHYFTIKDIDADSKTIKLTSPIDTSKIVEISYDEAKALGISIDGGTTKVMDLPNSVRSANDKVFKGTTIKRSEAETKQISQLLLELDSVRKQGYDETTIHQLIEKLDNGHAGHIVSEIEYIRIRNKAFSNMFNDETIQIGGRDLYLTPNQREIYENMITREITPDNINHGYCAQVIMSDAMFIEATAVSLGLDIKGKNTQEIFNELSERFIMDGEDIFPGIENTEKFCEAFFGRSNLTDSIKNINEMSGDKAVHQMNELLMRRFEGNKTFQENWIKYCSESGKFKQLSAVADTYKQELRTILKANGVPKNKIEQMISENLVNEDHIIFRALQRDAFMDLNNAQVNEWSSIEPTSFTEVLANKLIKKDKSEEFMGSILKRYNDKFDTIVYNLRRGSWDKDAIYLPQYAS